MRIRSLSDYNLNPEYQRVLNGYFDDAVRILGDRMIVFMLTSSCGLEKYIPGWSDIDILIVADKLDFASLRELHNAQAKYSIKIALALLSQHEFNEKMFDDKTNVVFYQVSEGLLAPNFVKKEAVTKFPNVTIREIQEDDKCMMPMYLHKLRRALYAPSNDKRIILKTLYIVLKMCLRSEGHCIIAKSYSEAFDMFASEFNEQKFDIMTEMISGTYASTEFINYARHIVEKICNNQL